MKKHDILRYKHQDTGECISELLGRPYEIDCDPPNSFNCWEFFTYLRAHYLPPAVPASVFDAEYVANRPDLRASIEAAKQRPWWNQISSYKHWRDGDLVLMHRNTIDDDHCGVYVAGHCMHAMHNWLGTGMVVLTSMGALHRYYTRVTVWRLDLERFGERNGNNPAKMGQGGAAWDGAAL